MHPIIGIIIILIVFCTTMAIVIPLFWAIIRGAPYMPTKNELVDDMIALADISQDDVAADLGSGDGRLVIALANKGITAVGYEINPWLVWWSKLRIRHTRSQNHASVVCRDFWNEDFSRYSVILLYILPETMAKLEPKLKQELKPGARIVSNNFTFPTWKPAKKDGRLTLYIR